MNYRAIALGLACLASFVTQSTVAQGLRQSGAAGAGLARTAPATPSLALPVTGDGAALRQVDFIVAVVNSEPVTNNEVRARAARIAQQMAQQGVALPPRDLLAREVLERLILEKIQLQQAREVGIRVDDFAVGQAEESVAKQNSVSVEEMHRRLAADGISKERFREELRNQLLLQRLRERDVQSRVRVSDLDVDQYLREQQSVAEASGLEINLGHILVTVPENASPAEVAELQARAQRAADKVRDGEDFAAVAREFSDGPEAKTTGGLLGMRPTDRYPELFVSATAQLPVGGIAGPIRSAAGFHVIKVVEKTTAGVPSLVTQSHARHILLRTGPQLTESAAAARLADYRRRIVSGQADFADLAREHSQDGSAKQGGDLGWSNPGRYVPEFEQALNALESGEVSEPLVSRFGVHLIQLIERRQAKLTQREQRDMARDIVREKKVEEAFSNWMQELRGRAYVEYREAPQ